MSHADDREYSYGEAAIKLTEYICEHGSITMIEARRVVGGNDDRLYRLLRLMDRVLCVYKDGKRRVLRKQM